MPCCNLLIVFAVLVLTGLIGVFIWLYVNNFRLWYLDLKMLFRGRTSPEAVGDYYDEWNERYKEVYGDTIQSYRSENTDLLHDYVMKSAGLQDGMRILDAGCGLCGPAIYFAKHRNIRIEAVTVSKVQADDARNAVASQGLQHKINVSCADYHKMGKQYEKSSFDVVMFLESYGHARDHKELIAAAAHVLKPGGYVYIKDYFKKDMPADLLQKQLIKMGIKNMDAIYRYHTPDLYHTIYLFRKLNFELRRIQLPELPDWDQNKVIQSFHHKNNIAFYNGKDHLFDQKNGRFIVDPYEMVFVKR